MTLAKRVAKLGVSVHARAAVVLRPKPFDEADWLAQFEVWGKNGCFAHEPDFDRGLGHLGDELATARLSTDPPFDPPDEFHPRDAHHIRLECWRSKYRFPALCEALGWLQEMRFRIKFGVPPVGEAEFRELETWFLAHEPQLDEIVKAENGLKVGSRRMWCWEVRYGLRDGPRGEDSGRTAEQVRQIRSRYGDRVTPTLDTLEGAAGGTT